jgi:protein-tyrosine-phosphatase
MTKSILFLCTGNYYRSRFAEEMFNYLARQSGLEWIATSRALAIEKGTSNIGPISPHTRIALKERNIPLADPLRGPIGCTNEDLAAADRIIALKELEHRPYVAERHPAWVDRIEYWHVDDLDQATADQALPKIETHVRELIASLQG